jgi:hypothetical protein
VADGIPFALALFFSGRVGLGELAREKELDRVGEPGCAAFASPAALALASLAALADAPAPLLSSGTFFFFFFFF